MNHSNDSVTQLSPEWFEQRKGRITGSRIGAILGVSPWQTPDDVLRAMVREHHGAPDEFVDNPAVQWGRARERQAMLAFMRETDLRVDDVGFLPYGELMGASPDGLTSDGGVLEIKVPFGLRNGDKPFKPLNEQMHYYHQVQMEMVAADRTHAYFVQYIAPKGDPFAHDYVAEQINIERAERNPNWTDEVLPEVSAFYDRYVSELDNPEHLEPLRVEIDAPRAQWLLDELDAIRERKKTDSEREKEIMGELVELADGKNALVHGRKLTKVVRVGSVSWAKVAKDTMPDGFDVEPYRGKGSESWRVA